MKNVLLTVPIIKAQIFWLSVLCCHLDPDDIIWSQSLCSSQPEAELKDGPWVGLSW